MVTSSRCGSRLILRAVATFIPVARQSAVE